MPLAIRFTPPNLLVGTKAIAESWQPTQDGWERTKEVRTDGQFVRLGLTDDRVEKEFLCEVGPEWEYVPLEDQPGYCKGVLSRIYLRVQTPGGRMVKIYEDGEVVLVEKNGEVTLIKK